MTPFDDETEDGDEAELERAAARLKALRAEADRAPLLPPPTAAGKFLLKQALTGVRVQVVNENIVWGAAFAAFIADAVESMMRRCDSRGVHPGGDAAAALMAWEGRDGWAAASQVIADRCRLIYVTGGLGTGKSSIGARAVVEWHHVGTGPKPLFVAASRLATALTSQSKESHRALAERAARAQCVCIDDISRDPPTAAAVAALRELFCERVEKRLTTVVTGNEGHESFLSAYVDERLRDRLMARGAFCVVSLNGASRRQEGP